MTAARRGLALIALVTAAPLPAWTQPASVGVLTGQVVDRAGQPQAGVTVIAAGQLTVTDEGGRFELLVPAGVVHVELSAPWLQPLAADEAVAPEQRRDVRYTLQPSEPAASAGEIVEIRGSAPVVPGRQRLDAATARAVPGASGEVLKVVESLAGVARPAPGKAELVVWGAAPEDTQVLVDGVPIPSLYHVGGWRAAVGGELVTDVTLWPGAFGPEHGGALGGIITVATEAPAGDGATAAVDLLDVSGSLHRQLGDTRVAVTGRWSYLDRVIAAADAARDARRSPASAPSDVAALVPVPRWGDGDLIVQRPLAGGEARLFALGARDRLRRAVDSDDPAERKQQALANDFWRLGVRWRGPASGGTATLTAYLGGDDETTALRFGPVPADLGIRRRLGGVRAERVEALSASAVLTLGAEASWQRATLHRDGSLGTPAREGDVAIFGQPPGDDVAADDWIADTGQAAGFLALDWLRGPLTISPGLRLDGVLVTASRTAPRLGGTPEIGFQRITLEPQPRVAVRYHRAAFALSAEGGMYAQPRRADDASAVFGSPRLGVEHALHGALGGAYQRGPLSIEATGYVRVLRDLVARHPAATPPLTGALTQDGSGLVMGVQLVAKLLPWHGLAGWLSYGLSRSQRRDAAGQELRLFDHDQTHLVTLVAGWQRGRWSAGGRLRVASGEPRTPVVGAFVDARTGRFQPILGRHNGERLPAFAQLDVRGERQLALGGGQLALYLELQNLTSRANAEEIVYSADYRDRDVLRGLPLLAVVGARWQR